MTQKSKLTLAGALLVGLGAFAMSASPSIARGGHGGTTRQVNNGPDAVIVTTQGPNGPVRQRVAVDNLAAAIASGWEPGPNVQVVGHAPGARATRTSFQARRKAKKAAERAARDAARGR